MMVRVGPLVAFLMASTLASAQSITTPATAAETRGDHTIVYELGWAPDWSHDEGLRTNGGTFAVEVEPIEGWLEIEIGITAIRANGVTELPADVLFKKPWTISQSFEFMVGVGPEVIHATGADHATFWGLSAVLDFMFWPSKNVGWYLEPGYEATFRNGTTRHGIGMAAGLLLRR